MSGGVRWCQVVSCDVRVKTGGPQLDPLLVSPPWGGSGGGGGVPGEEDAEW